MNIKDRRTQVIGAGVIIIIIVLLVVFIPGSPNGGTVTPTPTLTSTPGPTGTAGPTPTATPTPNPGEVLIQIPAHAAPCADISATVSIGETAGLQYGDFDVIRNLGGDRRFRWGGRWCYCSRCGQLGAYRVGRWRAGRTEVLGGPGEP